MKPRDLFALLLIVLASAATLFVLQSPNITGSYFADYGPVWTDEQTTYYLAEGVALKLNLDESFAGPLPMKYKISEPDQLYAYIDGKNLVVTPAPSASGTLTLIVTASDGSSSAEQTLSFVVDTPQEEEPSYGSSINQYAEERAEPRVIEPQEQPPETPPSEPPGQEKNTEQSSEYIYSEQGETVGRKISDNPDFEVNFTFVGRRGNDFVIEFYHNASEDLPAWVEGAIVTMSDKAKPKKNISISIPLDGVPPKAKIPHFILHIGSEPESYEFGITIINVQSYPTLGGNWTVFFNTTGTANLSITGINGTVFGEDLEFLDLKCGNSTFPHSFDNITVHAENYSCDETGSETSKVLTTGKHTLQFTFGDDVDYAFNDVSISACTNMSSSDRYILSTSVTAAGTCMNITVSNVELDCNGFNITFGTGGSDLSLGVNVTAGLTNITIRNCGMYKPTIAGDFGIPILFSGQFSNHSLIINNTLRSNGDTANHGIHMNAMNNVSIINNTIEANGTGFTNLALEFGSMSNLTVVGNNVSTRGSFFNVAAYLPSSQDSLIENNTFSAYGLGGRNWGLVFSGGNSTIRQNTITTNGTQENYGLYVAFGGNSVDAVFNSNNITTNGTSSHGIATLTGADDNNFTSNSITTLGAASHGIQVNGSIDNLFTFNLVNVSQQTSNEWNSLFETTTPQNNVVINLTLVRNNINISFEDFNGTSIKGVLNTESRANVNNPAQISLNKFVNVTNNTATSWLFLNITYFQSEITGMPENTIRIWRFNDSENMWFDENFFQSSGLDAANNIVFANITNFSTFGAFASILFVNKTDNPDPVNISGTLNYTIFINASKGNATNITVNDTYPSQVIFISSEPTADSGTNNHFSIGNLTENQTFRVNISVLINDTTANGTIITNRANVSFTNETGSRLNTTAIEMTTVIVPTINITSCPITLNSSAIVSQNVSANLTEQQSCITIGNDNIQLDCEGFTLRGNNSGVGVNSTSRENITIKNCFITNFTNNILFSSTLTSTIFNNSALNSTSASISMLSGSSNNVTNNTITGAQGVQLADSSNIFRGNFINSTTSQGINIVANSNTLINNTVIANAARAIIINSASSNFFENNTANSTSSSGIELIGSSSNTFRFNRAKSDSQNGILLTNSFSNTFANTTTESDDTSGAFSALTFAGTSENNSFSNTTIEVGFVWKVTGATSTGNNFSNTTFNATNGSIRILSNYTMPNVTSVNTSNLDISFNNAFLNSTNLSFLNLSAQIILRSITFLNPQPIVDFEDDGTFINCSASICTEVSFANNVYVYNVTRFTNYSSAETTINACGTISNSSTLGANISSAGTCITFGADNIFLECNGFTITYDSGGTGGDGVVANNKTNITVRNCIIIDVNAGGSQGVAIDMHDVQDGSYYNNTIHTNSTTNGYGMFLRNNITNNLIENNTIRARGSSTNNVGIYFSAIANARNFDNRIAGNVIFSNGTDANYGIFFEDNNSNSTITQNNITTNGSLINYGIYLDAATAGHEIKGVNITFNRVTTNGSSNSQEGVRLVTHIFNTLIANNTIETGVRSPVAGNSHFGINLLSGAGNITIVGNFVGTRGASDGIEITGTTFPDFIENITIINNTVDTGGASGDGIEIVQNARFIHIENNTIMTGNQSRRAGTAHGGLGIRASVASGANITIFNNSVATNGSGANNVGIQFGNFENASAVNNTISTFGTNDNYGIQLNGGPRNVTLENNTIFSSGTSVGNRGIHATGNIVDPVIRYNNITTNGTSANDGILLSSAAATAMRFRIEHNLVRTNGTSSSNRGIVIEQLIFNGTVNNNTVDTNGTGSDHGIILTIANAGIANLIIGILVENNTIRARSGGTATIGLRIVATNVVNNTARFNNISVNGTNSVTGIEIGGTSVNHKNSIENNTVFVNATGVSSRGIIIATTAATAASNITNNNVTIFSASTDVRALAVEAVVAVNNSYQNNTFIVQRGAGALFYVVSSSNQHFNRTVVNASDGTNLIWIDAAAGSNNNFTNTTFANANGSIRFNGTIEYTPTATDLTQVFMNISRNNTKLNSSTFSAFNTTAQLVFFNITFTDPKPMYNLSSTLPYEDCPSSICTEDSFDGFTYIYNVTRFTNFSSSENSTPVADLVVLQGDYTANITLQQSVICTFRSDNLSNASGCTVVANNDTAYALRNNGTISFGLNVSASGCPFESGCIQQVRLNGTNSSSQSSSCNLALNFITVPNTGAQLNIHKNVSAGEELHVHLNYTFSVPLTPPGAKNVTYTFTAVTDSPYYDPNC
ncbi:MAG TPA: right-handed parallel beta-helix repeat-containing protein [Candidatus Nanoarchaeia archaeon]|nr:right-handed parallel beta-helix repeat-containing protein [Candidatus Nanoarchaeia archaeon]